MNKIYIKISELSGFFRKMCYGITKNHTDIDNAVQELMLYFLSMNPDTLRGIYEKDKILGIKKYGAVVLKRFLTSPRSSFYYKYKKYYTNLCGVYMVHTDKDNFHKSIFNIPNEEKEVNHKEKKLTQIENTLEEMYWYDKKVFELYYYESNTLDSLAEKTGISRNSLFNTIDRVRETIKNKIDEEKKEEKDKVLQS
tara:strand:+ start:4265 stop:4852 length:588 start_codon:yes stop_codon:yes gene_type:complete